MIRSELLAKICCPHTGESLTRAPAEILDCLRLEMKHERLFNQLGVQVERPIEDGLVNDSASCFIMVHRGIPDLTPDQTIPIDHLEFIEPNSESTEVRTDE